MAAGISTRNRATMEKSYLLLKLKACAGQRVTLFERLDWKTPCLMHTLANQLYRQHTKYLGVLRLCRWSQPGLYQNSALFISEIRVERSHSMFCTHCHKIDITTGFCSWVEIYPYKKKQWDLVCYRASQHQVRRGRRAARSSMSQGSAEPFCARIKGANRWVSEEKYYL